MTPLSPLPRVGSQTAIREDWSNEHPPETRHDLSFCYGLWSRHHVYEWCRLLRRAVLHIFGVLPGQFRECTKGHLHLQRLPLNMNTLLILTFILACGCSRLGEDCFNHWDCDDNQRCSFSGTCRLSWYLDRCVEKNSCAHGLYCSDPGVCLREPKD